jgi:hypothetical protein
MLELSGTMSDFANNLQDRSFYEAGILFQDVYYNDPMLGYTISLVNQKNELEKITYGLSETNSVMLIIFNGDKFIGIVYISTFDGKIYSISHFNEMVNIGFRPHEHLAECNKLPFEYKPPLALNHEFEAWQFKFNLSDVENGIEVAFK